MENKYEAVGDYDYKMIEAFVDKPEVTQWYVNAFKRYSVNGIESVKWNWSWWAFFGNVFYLLYRKSYLWAFVLFILSFAVVIIPFGTLVLWILAGGFAPYFVHKTYQDKKTMTEATVEDEAKRVETMENVGGYNEWAIWLGVLTHLFIWGFVFLFFSAFLASIGLAVLVS